MSFLFNYTDYRLFLREYCKFRKGENPHFSLRLFGQKIGINAGSLLGILQGKRNISQKIALRFTGAMKMTRKETDYFQLLVLFDQARSHEEKKIYLEKILSFRKAKTTILDGDRYEVFSKWYYIAIRELLSHYSFTSDYNALAKMLMPSIKPEQAKSAITLLEKLELIRKNEQGEYKPTERFISTPEQWQSVPIANYQIETMKLAEESLDRFKTGDREVSTVTLNLSAKGLETIKNKLRELGDTLLSVENDDQNMDRVFQVNFQVFPLSKSSNPGDSHAE